MNVWQIPSAWSEMIIHWCTAIRQYKFHSIFGGSGKLAPHRRLAQSCWSNYAQEFDIIAKQARLNTSYPGKTILNRLLFPCVLQKIGIRVLKCKSFTWHQNGIIHNIKALNILYKLSPCPVYDIKPTSYWAIAQIRLLLSVVAAVYVISYR